MTIDYNEEALRLLQAPQKLPIATMNQVTITGTINHIREIMMSRDFKKIELIVSVVDRTRIKTKVKYVSIPCHAYGTLARAIVETLQLGKGSIVCMYGYLHTDRALKDDSDIMERRLVVNVEKIVPLGMWGEVDRKLNLSFVKIEELKEENEKLKLKIEELQRELYGD